jgi:hypothetical protein
MLQPAEEGARAAGEVIDYLSGRLSQHPARRGAGDEPDLTVLLLDAGYAVSVTRAIAKYLLLCSPDFEAPGAQIIQIGCISQSQLACGPQDTRLRRRLQADLVSCSNECPLAWTSGGPHRQSPETSELLRSCGIAVGAEAGL